MSSQANRGITLSTDAGADLLLIYRMTVTEQLSHSFEIELDLLSENPNIDLESLLGTSGKVEVLLPSGASRFFNGVFNRFSWAGTHGNYYRYRARLVPWFWFLTRTADCRIFQNMKSPDIIKQVFSDNSFSDHSNALTATYSEWEYCVQYRESDFDFVSRLMEHEGIYYFYKHEGSKHELVMCDGVNAHDPIPGGGTMPFFPPDTMRMRERECIYDWSMSYQVQTGEYELTDYDFENPDADMVTKSLNKRQHALSSFAIYDYPGEYDQKKASDNYPVRRLEEQQARYVVARGKSNSFSLPVGSLFKLQGHPRSGQDGEYLLLSSKLEFVNNEYETGTEQEGMKMHCDFEAIPSSTVFRPARKTPQPRIRGPQTAVVVGVKDQEIWTDKYGRVKVQFHWDREGKMDENSSCWVRVSQSWAGKRWGAMHIPRIGQEVIVEFLEGDPDRPIITGRIYNATMMPPYELPDNQTQSGIKSQSTTKANQNNFNELRFEDKKGEEHIYFHAEKDFERVVENNDTLRVGFDKKDSGDQVIEIFNNQKVIIGDAEATDGSQEITVLKDYKRTISEGDATITITKGKRTTTIEGDDTATIKTGNKDLTVSSGDSNITISKGTRTTSINGDDTLTIKSGKHKTKAAQEILLEVGGSSIKIDTQGITIKGMKVSIEADLKAGIKGTMVEANGSGTLTLKGGLTKIN